MRSTFVAFLLLLVACSSDDSGSPGSGGANTKNAGDSCTCENPKDGFGPSTLGGCGGDAAGCFSLKLLCRLASPIPRGSTGSGTCLQTCSRDEEGKQGSCPSGKTCSASDGQLLCQ